VSARCRQSTWASWLRRTILSGRRQNISFQMLDPESTRLARLSHVQAIGGIAHLYVLVHRNRVCATAGSQV
jgi:hypothetical protein